MADQPAVSDLPEPDAPAPASEDLPAVPEPATAAAEPLIREVLLDYITPALGPLNVAFKGVK